MTVTTTSRGPSKGYYHESEAASQLGLTREELRALVRTHIAPHDDANDISSARYEPRDLLTLRLILLGLRPSPPPPPAPESGNAPA